MTLDFFKKECEYPAITSKSFGLCDDEDGTKAYPLVTDPEKWVAKVTNINSLPIVFRAIDKCVLLDHEFPARGRCDGMLTTDDHLYLVELKNQRAEWVERAKEQLLSTIDFLLDNHDVSSFKYKKAFACNQKRGKFAYIDNEENLRLYRTTGFRLDVQSDVVVI